MWWYVLIILLSSDICFSFWGFGLNEKMIKYVFMILFWLIRNCVILIFYVFEILCSKVWLNWLLVLIEVFLFISDWIWFKFIELFGFIEFDSFVKYWSKVWLSFGLDWLMEELLGREVFDLVVLVFLWIELSLFFCVLCNMV